MRFSVNVPNFGDFANPSAFADLARLTEQAGWDGLFVWDHLVHEKRMRRDIADPWILVAAAASVTNRIRLGTMVTPVARRRPQQLARQVTTLDHLSRGRMVLGVGLGSPVDDEYGSFGEPTDERELARRLDEGLEVIDRLWSGERVDHRGECYTVTDVVFLPTPVQRPRVPVWVGGMWPNRGPMRRAARWDGVIPITTGAWQALPPPLEEVRELSAFVARCRAEAGLADRPFDLVLGGTSRADSRDVIGPLAEAGMTWWDERIPHDHRIGLLDPIRRRVEQGPPKLD